MLFYTLFSFGMYTLNAAERVIRQDMVRYTQNREGRDRRGWRNSVRVSGNHSTDDYMSAIRAMFVWMEEQVITKQTKMKILLEMRKCKENENLII